MRGEILTFPDTLTTQGLSLLCFNIVGGEILTFPDTLTTQGISLNGVCCFTTTCMFWIIVSSLPLCVSFNC